MTASIKAVEALEFDGMANGSELHVRPERRWKPCRGSTVPLK
jgi:hypothetical protein